MNPHFDLQSSGATIQLKNGNLKIFFAVYVIDEDGTPVAWLKKKNFEIIRMVNTSSLPISVTGLSFSVWAVTGLYRIQITIKKWETELYAIKAIKSNRQGVTTVFVHRP